MYICNVCIAVDQFVDGVLSLLPNETSSFFSLSSCLRLATAAMVVKVHELRTKSKGDLQKQLEELKTELAALRVAKVTGRINKGR